ncbi:protein Mis18-beta isoform X2 [Poecile atricapillus]|uniref:protein Mis18-beta isoform X2 n=1 Tax=Poecile atricapillus TaxID=48891 RepID=UPI0027399B6D|nr:protein Mis18-beta isoform X2 [Poecile atricapillus]
MAVRRQLQQIFQDPRVVGTIVVEQASASAAPTAPAWKSPPPPSPPPPSPLPPPSPPPPSSSFPPAAVPVSPPRQQGPLPEECAVFHCRSCWTVLGDSLQLCAQEPPGLSVIICFKVTSDVTWEDSLLVGLEGALLECTYYLLTCRSCGLAVGFILYSCDSNLAYLRGLFCFFKDSIICYLLQNQIIIEASKVKFPAVTLKEHMHKVKEKLVDFNCRIELVIRKLEKL